MCVRPFIAKLILRFTEWRGSHNPLVFFKDNVVQLNSRNVTMMLLLTYTNTLRKKD